MSKNQSRHQEICAYIEESSNLYVFVHAGADEELIYELDLVESECYVNFLPIDKQTKLGEITPFLVKLDAEDNFTQWLLANDSLMETAFFINSKLTIDELASRFSHLLFCADDEGKAYYFSFYVAQIFVDYLSYLRAYEPAQCIGLLEDIDLVILPKILFTSVHQAKVEKNNHYLPLSTIVFLGGLTEEAAHPSGYLPPEFFSFFSEQRIRRYKSKAYERLSQQYPESSYSQTEKTKVITIMDNIITSAANYGITDEAAVEDLFEASWLYGRNIFESPKAAHILSQEYGQQYRAEIILKIAKDSHHG